MTETYQQLQNRAEEAERDAMINALAAANADSEAGKIELQTAWQNQDLASAAEAQERISRAQARAVTLESGIEGYDQSRHGDGRVVQAQPQPQQQQQRQQYTTQDIINSMPNLTAKERQWLMQHQELVSTPAGQSRLQTAYYDTQDKQIARDSDEYFDYFNNYFNFPQTSYSSAQSNTTQNYVVGGPNVQRQYQQPSKPYAPDTPKVSLTEKEAAKISGVDEATYQANKKKLQDLKKLGYYADR
jgi:hypothetical protein